MLEGRCKCVKIFFFKRTKCTFTNLAFFKYRSMALLGNLPLKHYYVFSHLRLLFINKYYDKLIMTIYQIQNYQNDIFRWLQIISHSDILYILKTEYLTFKILGNLETMCNFNLTRYLTRGSDDFVYVIRALYNNELVEKPTSKFKEILSNVLLYNDAVI